MEKQRCTCKPPIHTTVRADGVICCCDCDKPSGGISDWDKALITDIEKFRTKTQEVMGDIIVKTFSELNERKLRYSRTITSTGVDIDDYADWELAPESRVFNAYDIK